MSPSLSRLGFILNSWLERHTHAREYFLEKYNEKASQSGGSKSSEKHKKMQ